jgi:integrase
VNDFLGAQSRARRSKVHLNDLRQRLGRFCESFADRPVRSIATEETEAWLHGLGLGPQSINNYRDRLGALFEYAVKRELLGRNPVAAVERVTLTNEPPVIYSPDELKALLAAAPPDLVPAVALAAFGGLRTAELLRLTWADINLERGHIEVTAAKAKTASRRLVPIQPNLDAWLRRHAPPKGRVYPKGSRHFHRAMEEARKRAGVPLKPNAARHSFASYRLAATQNGPQVAMEMGHASPAMTIRHYRELVGRAEATAYWAIGPDNGSPPAAG